MRNMRYYDLKEPFEAYKEAVNRKTNQVERQELRSVEAQMNDCYTDYDNHFLVNDLELLPSARVGIDHKEALLGLYGSKVKLVKDFRKRYFEINPQTYNNLCPYCVVNSANTTEHILPKEKYPEYAVNVKNLIPGCGECNSAKGEEVIDQQGRKIILNFYTDILPNEQFLFVDISNSGGGLYFEYVLRNVQNRIDINLYGLIERHFNRLHLLQRYKDKAIQEFAEIRNTYKAEGFADDAQFDVFATKQLRKCDMDAAEYGRNHWKVVLLRACAESDVFKQFILQP